MNESLSGYSQRAWTSFRLWAAQKWTGTLIMLFAARETDDHPLSSSMVNIGNINTHMQTAETPHNEDQNYQVKLFPHLITENHLPRTTSSSSLSQFFFPALSLSPRFVQTALSPLTCLLCWCCSRQNDITPLSVDCSVVKTRCVRMCVCMYTQGGRLEINILTMKLHCIGQLALKNQHFHKRQITCVFFISEWNRPEFVWRGEIRHEAWMGKREIAKIKIWEQAVLCPHWAWKQLWRLCAH